MGTQCCSVVKHNVQGKICNSSACILSIYVHQQKAHHCQLRLQLLCQLQVRLQLHDMVEVVDVKKLVPQNIRGELQRTACIAC